MIYEIIASESFSHGDKTYFFDFMRAANGSYYVRITRSDRRPDGHFEKQRVVFFEENFGFMLEALSSLFRSAAYQQAGKPVKTDTADQKKINGIKSWPEEHRPREKLLALGRDALSDAELVALLIGGGSPRETAVDLAGHILGSVDFSLLRLSKQSLEYLCRFRGMGHAKSSAIVAAMELAKRMLEESLLLQVMPG